MKNLMMSLVVVATMILATACGGSAGAGAEANTAGGTSSESRVAGTWISGQSTDATETVDATGESTEAPAPAPAQPANSNRALPPECNGKMPQAVKMAQGTLVCRCESAGHEAVWSTFVWDTDAYPNCKIPYPDQVLNRVVHQTSARRAGDDPYKEDAAAAKVEGTATTTATTSSRTQVTCSTKMNGESRIATCHVAKDNQPMQEFTCVGPKVRDLTVAQKTTYTGGPPCTCESGTPQPLGTSVPNTWQCK